MKKRFGLLLATILVASTAAIAACNTDSAGVSSGDGTSTPPTSSSTLNDPTSESSSLTPGTYAVTFNSDGGSTVSTATVKDGEKVTKPTDPTKAGYTFAGWTVNGAAFDFNTAITDNITLKATWTANTDTAYVVKHFQQNLENDEYTEVTADAENKTGTTATQTSAEAKSYTGFTAKSFEQVTIAGDGSSVVSIYYDRNTYTVSFEENGGSEVSNYENVKYGATVSAPQSTKDGYTFEAWDYDFTTPITDNTTVTASWTAIPYTATIVRADGTQESITFTVENRDEIALTPNTNDCVYAWATVTPSELKLENDQTLVEMQSVSTKEQFLALNGKSGYYFLIADIDFGGATYNACLVNSFTGTLDGNGYSVKNLTITSAADSPASFGVFQTMSGTIRNMGFENITLSGWGGMHGNSGIVAVNADGATLENIYISGSMELVNAKAFPWADYTKWGFGSGFLASSANGANVSNVFCDVKYKDGTDISCVAGKGTVNLGDYIFNSAYGTLNNWGSYNKLGWAGTNTGDAPTAMLSWDSNVWSYAGSGMPSLKENCTINVNA